MEDRVEFEETGRIWRRNFLTEEQVEALNISCDVGNRPGIRLLLSPELNLILGPNSTLSRELITLGVDRTPVRLIAFNKTPEANWGVPWHQDRVVAVKKNVACSGYSNWVAKDGFWHCEPPIELLARMLFVRIHLDTCDHSNGAMEIALGSHRLGKVPAPAARSVAEAYPIETCVANPGDVLILKALTLHRSKGAVQASSRRALRVDYGRRTDLDPQLDWSIGN